MNTNPPWNKGLTKETDERVKRNSEAVSKATIGRASNAKDKKFVYRGNKNKLVKKEDLQNFLDAGWELGMSEESKKNMSKAGKGKLKSEEYKKAHRVPKSEETKQRMRKPKSKEHAQNISKGKTGTHLTKEHRKNVRLSVIKRIEEINGYIYPGYNPEGCKYFNLLMEQTNTFIQHAENGGEFHIRELGYFVDGYDKINNIVYEYDEAGHYENNILKEKDIKRQEEITEHLNCKFIRIKETKL